MRQILYLHGFNSSPQSVKARQTQAWLETRGLAEHIYCPALPYSPAAAAAVIEDHFTRIDPLQTTCIGSSLGGFYTTWAAERFGCRAVLINPAVRPYRLLDGLLGPQRNLYSGEEYILAAHHMDELVALEPARLCRERYWLLAEEGDETLDYRDAVAYYAGCRQTVHKGGDHGFQRWQGMLPEVMAWAGIAAKS